MDLDVLGHEMTSRHDVVPLNRALSQKKLNETKKSIIIVSAIGI